MRSFTGLSAPQDPSRRGRAIRRGDSPEHSAGTRAGHDRLGSSEGGYPGPDARENTQDSRLIRQPLQAHSQEISGRGDPGGSYCGRLNRDRVELDDPGQAGRDRAAMLRRERLLGASSYPARAIKQVC
jgi:hypothetical protein